MKKIILTLLVFFGFSLAAMAAVNINTATQAELESLDGIGPKKAQAIIGFATSETRVEAGEFNFTAFGRAEHVDGHAAVVDAVKPTLRRLRAAAARLGVQRAARGGMAVERGEARLHFDAEGRPSGVSDVVSTTRSAALSSGSSSSRSA